MNGDSLALSQGTLPIRIGVFPVALTGPALEAFRYLLLVVNQKIRSLQFELCAIPDDPFLRKLCTKEPVPAEGIEGQADQFIERYESLFAEDVNGYQIEEGPPKGYLLLTNTTFDNNYYGIRSERVHMVALGNWSRHMAPPSIVEFFLFLTLRYSVGFVDRSFAAGTHLNTRGCLWDFTPDLSETRYKILTGFVCEECAARLRNAKHDHLVQDLATVFSKTWLRKPDESSSPAAMVRRLGYDLFVTKGLRPTAWERVRSTIEDEAPKQLLVVVATIAIAALLLWLGLKG